ncbi:MAG: heparan N-sulfatase, partial [Planctomycetaceae bacterium]|nr:heparan N-sulfatase [Planctomycetaceae bacterium]
TALVARWPGVVAAGKRTDALVQYTDVLPTLMAAVGADVAADQFDGTSFLSVLQGETDSHREYAFGMHNNLPEGPAYPIRTVTDGTTRYIRNLTPDEIYIEKHLMGVSGNGRLNNLYWQTWVWDATESDHTYNLVRRYTRRPPEQLYVTEQDRYELNNVVDDPNYQEIQSRLSGVLDDWMRSQGDPGIPQDTREALQASRKGHHLYGPDKK